MSQFFRLADHVSLTKLDDEAVLLDLQTGAYFGLNHVGLALIEALNQGSAKQQAIESIAQTYQTPVSQVMRDAAQLINEMVERKLILAV